MRVSTAHLRLEASCKLADSTMMPMSAGIRNRQLPQLVRATAVLKMGKVQTRASARALYQCLRSATAAAATNTGSGKLPRTLWDNSFQIFQVFTWIHVAISAPDRIATL